MNSFKVELNQYWLVCKMCLIIATLFGNTFLNNVYNIQESNTTYLTSTHLEHSIAGGSQHGQHHTAQRGTASDSVHVGEQRDSRIAHNDRHNLRR